jgi:hypothetical protein
MPHNFQPLCSYTVTLQMPPEAIGPVAEGIRVNFYLTGGVITGERLRGEVLPVGADWLLIRRDGVGVVDVRATMKTHDGALLYATYTGLLDLGPDGYEKFLRGELPAEIPIRTAPRFQTSHPDYLWLNRLQCFGVGIVEPAKALVTYDVYSV